MKHRILHIVSDLAHGGTQRQMALVAAGLPRDEFDVQVVALGRSGPVAVELMRTGVPVTVLGGRGRFDLGAWWKTRRFIVESRSGFVHVWDDAAALKFATTALLNAPYKSLVLTQRAANTPISGRSLLDRLFVNRAAMVVASCRSVEHALGQRGWPVETQMLIWDGVPAGPVAVASREALLTELQIPENARLLITVGSLTREKRLKDLIWATDMLKFFRDDVHLLIVGDGPDRARLERFRSQCEIEDKVHFLGDRSDVPQLLPHCDVFCSASGVESPSIAILEAMMAGVPVVAVDTPVNRELVALGETGLLVPRGDRNQFARCAHKLTTDAALCERLAKASRRRAIEHFSAEQMIARYAELYRQVLAKI